MASVIWDTVRYVDANGGSYQDVANALVGKDDYGFSHVDMCADADAIKIAKLISISSSTTHSFSETLRNYYNNYMGYLFVYLACCSAFANYMYVYAGFGRG